MEKWCNQYECLCSDVDDIIGNNVAACDRDCNNCGEAEEGFPD